MKTRRYALAAVMGLGGLFIVWLGAGPLACAGVFFCLWGHNLGHMHEHHPPRNLEREATREAIGKFLERLRIE